MYGNKYKENAYLFWKEHREGTSDSSFILTDEAKLIEDIFDIKISEFEEREREENLIEQIFNLLPSYTSSFEIEYLQEESPSLTLTISSRQLTDLVRKIIAAEED